MRDGVELLLAVLSGAGISLGLAIAQIKLRAIPISLDFVEPAWPGTDAPAGRGDSPIGSEQSEPSLVWPAEQRSDAAAQERAKE